MFGGTGCIYAISIESLAAEECNQHCVESELDRAGRSELHYVALAGDVDRARALLKAGADVALPDRNGYTPLHFAAEGLHADMAGLLLDAGGDVDARDRFGKTPLSVAIFNVQDRDGEVVRVLLEAGADPDAENDHGVSPRTLATKVANYDLKRFFV